MEFFKRAISGVVNGVTGGIALDFPFVLDDLVQGHSHGIWSIYNGHSLDGDPVSIFVGDANKHPSYIPLFKNAIKRLKTLRHPVVLEYLGSSEMKKGQFLLATQRITPLSLFISQGKVADLHVFLWWIFTLMKGCQFLHNHAKIVHGALIFNHCLFVLASGELRLGGFEVATLIDHNEGSDGELLLRASKHFSFHKEWPPESKNGTWSEICKTAAPEYDSWMLAKLIISIQSAAKISNVPKEIFNFCQFACSIEASERMTPSAFMRSSDQSANPLFKLRIIELSDMFDNYSALNNDERERFLSSFLYNDDINQVSVEFCKHKIIPLIAESSELKGADCAASVNALLACAARVCAGQKKVDSVSLRFLESFLKSIHSKSPIQVLAFISSIVSLFEALEKNWCQKKLFEPLIHCCSHSHSQIRACSLQTALVFSAKFSSKQLNGEFLRVCAKFQIDKDAQLRLSVIKGLSDLAPILDANVRKKILSIAFSKSFGDSADEIRMTSLNLFGGGLMEFVEDQSLVLQILPSLSPHLLDPNRDVRKAAFALLEKVTRKLQNISSSMPHTETSMNPSSHSASPTTTTVQRRDFSGKIMSLADHLMDTALGEAQGKSAKMLQPDHQSTKTNPLPNSVNEGGERKKNYHASSEMITSKPPSTNIRSMKLGGTKKVARTVVSKKPTAVNIPQSSSPDFPNKGQIEEKSRAPSIGEESFKSPASSPAAWEDEDNPWNS